MENKNLSRIIQQDNSWNKYYFGKELNPQERKERSYLAKQYPKVKLNRGASQYDFLYQTTESYK